MVFLPVVARELRVAARWRSTYWVRFAAALGALLLGLFLMLTCKGQPMHEVGQIVFVALSWMTFLLCLLSGLWLTSDSISEEKREGTLGLLFLTDLKGYDVVLGKLAANSLNALFAALAVVPVLALTLLAGGITPGEVLRVALALGTALLLSLAVGMLASVVCRGSRQAMGLTFLALLVIAAFFPLAGALAGERFNNAVWTQFLYLPSPAFAMVWTNDSPYSTNPKFFWISLAINLGLSLLCLALACLLTPSSWQADRATLKDRGARAAFRRFWLGGGRWRARQRAKKLAINPFYWLLCRERWKPAMPWVVWAAAVSIWAWGWHENKRAWLETSIYVTTALLVCPIFKIWVALEAGRWLGAERRAGTLELLMTTPLTVRQILAAHWRALARLLGGPILACLGMLTVFMFLDLFREKEDPFKWLAYMVVCLADVLALAWLSMWLSLRFAKPHRAMLAAILLVLPLPWILYGLLMMMMAITTNLQFFNVSQDFIGLLMIGLWLFICLAIDSLAVVWGYSQLISKFRQVAVTAIGRRPVFQPPRRAAGIPPVVAAP